MMRELCGLVGKPGDGLRLSLVLELGGRHACKMFEVFSER